MYTQIPCGWKPPAFLGQLKFTESNKFNKDAVVVKEDLKCEKSEKSEDNSEMKEVNEDEPQLRGLFVKGPLSSKIAFNQMWVNQLKCYLKGIETINTQVAVFVDRASGKRQYYIVMEDIGQGPYPYPHVEKTWKGQQINVYNAETGSTCMMFQTYLKQPQHQNSLLKLSKEVIERYLVVLLMRHWLCLSDTNNRNIVAASNNRVLSVDENVEEKPKKFLSHGSKQLEREICVYFDSIEFNDMASKLLSQWKETIISARVRLLLFDNAVNRGDAVKSLEKLISVVKSKQICKLF